MIITRNETALILKSSLGALIRKREPEIGSALELCAQNQDGKTRVIAKAVVKTVRRVSVETFEKNPELLTKHGFRSLNGLKRNVIDLYGESLWQDFQNRSLDLYRLCIDYSLTNQD